jgi:Flp pilus assembly pilin Flp
MKTSCLIAWSARTTTKLAKAWEYLLILALVAFACTAGMKVLANGVNQAFSEIGSLVNAYVT